MMSRVQKVITKLEEWGLTCGLSFNPSKIVVVIFTKKQLSMSQKPNKLQVRGLSVPFALSAKYLGVTLDSKLTWNLHFNNQLTKWKKYLHMLQKGVEKAWGPKLTYIRWIYTAIVRLKLTYAALSWGHSTCFANKHTALDKLNRLAATPITPVRRSTPVKTMELLYNLIPLHLYIRYKNTGMTSSSMLSYPYLPQTASMTLFGSKLTAYHLTALTPPNTSRFLKSISLQMVAKQANTPVQALLSTDRALL